MELIDKAINQKLNEELSASESDRRESFFLQSKRRFFATISAYIDSRFFINDSGVYDSKGHTKYNERATISLMNELKRFGLQYQRILGIWDGEFEKSFLVWNTAYTYPEFEKLILKLNKNFKQWAVCIGRWDEELKEYKIGFWSTNSLDFIDYHLENTFTKVSPELALLEVRSELGGDMVTGDSILERGRGTILTRKINDSTGRPDFGKIGSSGISFEALEFTPCLASSESLNGVYKRRELLKELD